MSLEHLLAQGFYAVTDTWVGLQRWPTPTLNQLANVAVVAHRGDPKAAHAAENTLPAFVACERHGVWGVELDVRWSKDNLPVVLHDRTGERTFLKPNLNTENFTAKELKQLEPRLPTLSEVHGQLSSRTHLMLELKEPMTPARWTAWQEALGARQPIRDYHVLALDPKLLESCTQVDPRALVLVSELKVSEYIQTVIDRGWGGWAGHYALLSQAQLERLKQAGCQVGVGYVRHWASLCREVQRGVDWLFSNHAIGLQLALREALTQHSPAG